MARTTMLGLKVLSVNAVIIIFNWLHYNYLRSYVIVIIYGIYGV